MISSVIFFSDFIFNQLHQSILRSPIYVALYGLEWLAVNQYFIKETHRDMYSTSWQKFSCISSSLPRKQSSRSWLTYWLRNLSCSIIILPALLFSSVCKSKLEPLFTKVWKFHTANLCDVIFKCSSVFSSHFFPQLTILF